MPFCARRVCARARARLGPLGLACAPARVWGFGGVVCLWGFGAGWGARGVCGGLVTRVECGGFDFFLPKKGPTGPVPAGPAGSRRDHAGAKARGAAPAPRHARAAEASCLYAGSAPSIMNAIDGGDCRLADDRRRSQILEKDYHPPPRPNASSRSSRNVPELCTYEPPSTTWTPPLALSSATFVASS